MGNLQMHLWHNYYITMQEQNVTKIVKNYHFEWLSTPITLLYLLESLDITIEGSACILENPVWIWCTLIKIFVQYITLKIWHQFRNNYRISAFCLSSKTEFILVTIFASIIQLFSKSENFKSIIIIIIIITEICIAPFPEVNQIKRALQKIDKQFTQKKYSKNRQYIRSDFLFSHSISLNKI